MERPKTGRCAETGHYCVGLHLGLEEGSLFQSHMPVIPVTNVNDVGQSKQTLKNGQVTPYYIYINFWTAEISFWQHQIAQKS